MIAAAGEELANDLTTKAQAIKAAASAVDNLLGKLADGAADALENSTPAEINRPLRRAKKPVNAGFTHAREPARRAELAHPNPLTSP